MTLQNFCSVFDPCSNIVIWHEDDNKDPIFQGTIFDIPFGWLKCKLVKTKGDIFGSYISQDLDANTKEDPMFHHQAGLVVTIKG